MAEVTLPTTVEDDPTHPDYGKLSPEQIHDISETHGYGMMVIPQVELARTIAIRAHAGQKRRDGKPYITHPKAVADSLMDPVLKTVAWLHDVLEDTNVTADDLIKEGVLPSIVDIVKRLTHEKGTGYLAYIRKLTRKYEAIQVKRADLEHNLSNLRPGHQKDKYELALFMLDNYF